MRTEASEVGVGIRVEAASHEPDLEAGSLAPHCPLQTRSAAFPGGRLVSGLQLRACSASRIPGLYQMAVRCSVASPVPVASGREDPQRHPSSALALTACFCSFTPPGPESRQTGPSLLPHPQHPASQLSLPAQPRPGRRPPWQGWEAVDQISHLLTQTGWLLSLRPHFPQQSLAEGALKRWQVPRDPPLPTSQTVAPR